MYGSDDSGSSSEGEHEERGGHRDEEHFSGEEQSDTQLRVSLSS